MHRRYGFTSALLLWAAAAVCAVAIAAAAWAAPSTPLAADTHLAYVGSADPVAAQYGRGDYLYSTVSFSGSALSGDSVLSVADLETLAIDGDPGLGYENTYSLMTSGAVFSKSRFTGVKLYDLLVRLGLDASAANSTPVRVLAADGYSLTFTLAQIRQSTRYACFAAKGDPTIQEADVPVLLSFAVDSQPLVGPTGDEPVTKVFTAADGYDEAADNGGGPVRLTVGQTSADDYNARYNAKWVTRIVVGDNTEPVHAGIYAPLAASRLAVRVYDGAAADPLKAVDYSVADVEASPAGMADDGYYAAAAAAFYKGVDLWQFLTQQVGLLAYEGTATIVAAGGEKATVDLAYLRNLGRDHTSYTATKVTALPGGSSAALTIHGIHPLLAFARNGYPMVRTAADAGYLATGVAGATVDNDDGPLAVLLPRDGTYLTDGECLRDVTRIDVRLDLPEDLHTGDSYGSLATQVVSLAGPGVKTPAEVTIGALEQRVDLMVTHDYGALPVTTGCTSCHGLDDLSAAYHAGSDGSDCLSCHARPAVEALHGGSLRDVSFGASGTYHGLDLLQLLKSAACGLVVDADTVTVTGEDGSSVAFSVHDLEAADAPVLLAFSRAGVPLVEGASSAGYESSAGNGGGPIMLVSRRHTVMNVTAISVSRQTGIWKHSQAPYLVYQNRALTVSGSEVAGTSVLSLEELEQLDAVRASFAASKGASAYQGVALRDLIVGRLAPGVSRPSRIRVFGADGYFVELAVADVLGGIDSSYQPGQHRDVILAYGKNGYPLVESTLSDGYVASALNDDGPVHLIVENTISAWVHDVRAIVVGNGDPVYAPDRVPAEAVAITSPTASQRRAYLAKGATLKLRAALTPSSSTDPVTWSTSNEACASVSARGVVTAKVRGFARITVRTSSKQEDVIAVYVTRRRDATSASLPRRMTLAPGAVVRLIATLAPRASTSQLVWRSGNIHVATVDRSGRVIALRPGRTTIMVRTANGKRAICVVVVRRA